MMVKRSQLYDRASQMVGDPAQEERTPWRGWLMLARKRRLTRRGAWSGSEEGRFSSREADSRSA